jgi:uncharacterized protein involved in response to NO
MLRAALLLGACGGFLLAATLTITRLLRIPEGGWWPVLAQAHGHLQVYGWAGLFVLGIVFYFLPRLRGSRLAWPVLTGWIWRALVTALVLRGLCQPLAAVSSAGLWHVGLIVSGLLECLAVATAVTALTRTLSSGPKLRDHPAFRGILPLLAGAFTALSLAALVNLGNMISVVGGQSGLIPTAPDQLNVTLGLLGFLVPMALAMSVRSLPMYGGISAVPARMLWPISGAYLTGLCLTSAGLFLQWMSAGVSWRGAASAIYGGGLAVLGATLVIFVVTFIVLMRRGRRAARRAQLSRSLAPSRLRPDAEPASYGPFVGLIVSAYLWALIGGVLLLTDGVALLTGLTPPVALDAARHSLALGFIALLMCGVAPRMVAGFSGGRIATPVLVWATLWLGNIAVALRVGALLAAPALALLGRAGVELDVLLFGLSGPVGLMLAVCFAINLWPALTSSAWRKSHARS